jgi:hypothetical protein
MKRLDSTLALDDGGRLPPLCRAFENDEKENVGLLLWGENARNGVDRGQVSDDIQRARAAAATFD